MSRKTKQIMRKVGFTGEKPRPVYLEPEIVVSPFPLHK